MLVSFRQQNCPNYTNDSPASQKALKKNLPKKRKAARNASSDSKLPVHGELLLVIDELEAGDEQLVRDWCSGFVAGKPIS